MCGGFPNYSTRGEVSPTLTLRGFLWGRFKAWLRSIIIG